MPSSTPRSRLTSSGLFDGETIRTYVTTKLLNPYRYSFAVCPGVNSDFVARYLLERPHTETTPTNSNFSALINYVVDELVKYDNDSEPEQLRYQYMKTLCHGISRQRSSRDIIYDIFPQTTRPVSSVEHRYHIFISAIYLEKSSVVQHMLEDEQIDLAEVKSEFFGTPLHAAVQVGHRDLVCTLLQHGADVNMEDPFTKVLPLDTAIINQDAEIIRLLLEPHYGHITSGGAFETAIVKGLGYNQPRVAHLLLEHMTGKLSECPYLLSEGLRAACRRGTIEIVQLLLDHGGDVNEHFIYHRTCHTPSLIEQAAWTGQEEVLRLLLARGANPYGWEPGYCSSMRAAAWGGHVSAARILLDAGVELKPSQWMSILNIAAPRVVSAELGRLLLDLGIFDCHMLDDNPQEAEGCVVRLMGLACQQGNIVFIQALAQHGVTVNDESLYTRHDCAPPIIVAMAYRQNHAVRVLRELGAREVDPLETIWGGDFANGRYPCDPPPPPECKMPWRL